MKSVLAQRAFLFTESFKETEGQPLVLRFAKALKHYAEKVLRMDEAIRGYGPPRVTLDRAVWDG